ncbi:MAG: co-chaperone GroES [Planctomycetaceae bacterium]|nr:co-chaperone GroES [Planctomycetaceae bacterium]
MKVIPLGDKVVVQRVEAEQTTTGGIVLPDSAQNQPAQGRVLSVGSGMVLPSGYRRPFQVKEGDRVVFTSWAGTEVDIDGEHLLVMSESDILAILQ